MGKGEVELSQRLTASTDLISTERAHQRCPELGGNDWAFITSSHSVTRQGLLWQGMTSGEAALCG